MNKKKQMMILVSRIVSSVIVLIIAYFVLHRIWTKDIDIMGILRKPAETIPVKKEILNIERLTPILSVKIFPLHNMLSKNDGGIFKSFTYMISNDNKESSIPFDCIIKFYFPYNVSNVSKQVIFSDGSNMTVAGLRIEEEDTLGNINVSEDYQEENSITNKFTIEIHKRKKNNNLENTNEVSISCVRWPIEASITGRITIDVSSSPNLIKTPDKIGSYSGIYYYEINNEIIKKTIKGDLPK